MPNSCPEIFRVDQVSKRYGTAPDELLALKEISLELGRSQSLALVGPSGCGKTTLLLLLAGLEQPTTGQITFNRQPLTRSTLEIALVLQNYGLFPWKTVFQNVELGLKIRGSKYSPDLITNVLEELEILDKINDYPQQLSGGQRQRVALARSIILDPALLLCDEPFAALDTFTRERLQDLLCEMWNSRKFSLVIATHSIGEAVRLGQKIVIMDGHPGQLVQTLDNPAGGSPGYRGTDEFYQQTRLVRTSLEQLF